MNKKGQFTLVVVLGIVVLLLIGLFILFQKDIFGFVGIGEELAYPSEVQEIVVHVQECVDTSVQEGVANIGYTGGYYVLPSLSYTHEDLGASVPYYSYDGNTVMISNFYMEGELSQYVTSLISSCIDLAQFSDFTLTEGDIVVSSTIEDLNVFVQVRYPLTATAGESSYTLPELYESDIASPLGTVYDVASSIITRIEENPNTVEYGSLLGYGLSKIVVAPIEQGVLLYTLQQENVHFLFAVHYALSESLECVDTLDCEDGFLCDSGVCVKEKVE